MICVIPNLTTYVAATCAVLLDVAIVWENHTTTRYLSQRSRYARAVLHDPTPNSAVAVGHDQSNDDMKTMLNSAGSDP